MFTIQSEQKFGNIQILLNDIVIYLFSASYTYFTSGLKWFRHDFDDN